MNQKATFFLILIALALAEFILIIKGVPIFVSAIVGCSLLALCIRFRVIKLEELGFKK